MHDTAQCLDRRGILARVPHQGTSCLLDSLLSWDTQRIVCETATHRDPHNVYRVDGRLSAVCAVEYAAQSFALHACLKAGADAAAATRIGYLASVREFSATTNTLDTLAGMLRVESEELAADENMLLYAFTVRHERKVIAQGRAAIAFLRDSP
jgi:predicted hotdog family 3-hydroxylacyl-ACP dehydratase